MVLFSYQKIIKHLHCGCFLYRHLGISDENWKDIKNWTNQVKNDYERMVLNHEKIVKLSLDKLVFWGYNYYNNCDEDGRYTEAVRDTAVGASRKQSIFQPFTSELKKGKQKWVVSSVNATLVQKACRSLKWYICIDTHMCKKSGTADLEIRLFNRLFNLLKGFFYSQNSLLSSQRWEEI